MIGQSNYIQQYGGNLRTCNIPYYQHPPSAADFSYSSAQLVYGSGIGPSAVPKYYDDFGTCTPYNYTTFGTPTVTGTFGIGTLLLIAAVAYGGYYLWTHRKKI